MRDALEATLAADWCRENLAVYADWLETQGDPRGEWIAVDLAIAAGGRTDELQRRHDEAIAGLVGDLAPSLIRSDLELGFVMDLRLDTGRPDPDGVVPRLLATPLGPYVRGATITGSTDFIKRTVRKLVAAPHTWMRRLTIRHDSLATSPIVSNRLAAALVAATPRLERLETRGNVLGDRVAHPTAQLVRFPE